jgi:nucleotide-binding universal stress UspA family protein
MHTGPSIIGYDGSPASEHAIRESASLLAGRPALVVVVWEAGRAFDLMLIPDVDFEPAAVDYGNAIELDLAMSEAARQLAQQGAEIARRLGVAAEALVVADEFTVAETLVRVAQDRDAASLVLGAPHRHRFTERLLGSTMRHILRHSPCPVVVVNEPADDAAPT